MPLLELHEAVSAYGKVEALKGLSLHVDEGEIVALLGANGAGKSTTLRTISGLMKPQSGSILFHGRPIGGLSPEAIVKLGSGAKLAWRFMHLDEPHHLLDALTHIDEAVEQLQSRPCARGRPRTCRTRYEYDLVCLDADNFAIGPVQVDPTRRRSPAG